MRAIPLTSILKRLLYKTLFHTLLDKKLEAGDFFPDSSPGFHSNPFPVFHRFRLKSTPLLIGLKRRFL